MSVQYTVILEPARADKSVIQINTPLACSPWKISPHHYDWSHLHILRNVESRGIEDTKCVEQGSSVALYGKHREHIVSALNVGTLPFWALLNPKMHSDSSLPLSENSSHLSLRTVWGCKFFLEMLRQCWHLIDTVVFRFCCQTKESKNCCRSCSESLTQKLFCQVQISMSDRTAAVGNQCSCTSLYVKCTYVFGTVLFV